MKLSPSDLQSLCFIAIAAARHSGELIQGWVGKSISVQEKETGSSPASRTVTEVDFKSQEIILQYLAPSLAQFDLGLLAEEANDDGSRFAKDYFWCIDPLDGTLQFTESRSGYAVSIALVSQTGEACIGVVYDPLTKTLYHAIKNGGAYRNEVAWSIDTEVKEPSKMMDHGGAVMNACWALDNAPAYFFKKPKSEQGGGCLWDYAATACLYRELGAWCSDMAGNALDLNQKTSLYMNQRGILFATNADIARKIGI